MLLNTRLAINTVSEKKYVSEVYGISGDKVYLVADIIGIIEKIVGRKFRIEIDKSLLRPTDEPIIYGDSTRLKTDTG